MAMLAGEGNMGMPLGMDGMHVRGCGGNAEDKGQCLWNVQGCTYGMQKGCTDEMCEGKCVECTRGCMGWGRSTHEMGGMYGVHRGRQGCVKHRDGRCAIHKGDVKYLEGVFGIATGVCGRGLCVYRGLQKGNVCDV